MNLQNSPAALQEAAATGWGNKSSSGRYNYVRVVAPGVIRKLPHAHSPSRADGCDKVNICHYSERLCSRHAITQLWSVCCCKWTCHPNSLSQWEAPGVAVIDGNAVEACWTRVSWLVWLVKARGNFESTRAQICHRYNNHIETPCV